MATNDESLTSSTIEPTNLSESSISSSENTHELNLETASDTESWSLLPKSFKIGRKLPNKTARDPMLIERSNLVNISKLVVKELIETSHKYGRMLDSDHLPLQHFFIVLEHVLRHGIKPKKGILGPKKELWDILQLVEKYSSDAVDTTASVRDLPTVTTAMGRARAWIRLSLMQKKLADYIKVLVDRKDEVLAEYFEPDALLMSDEAFIIVGLLVGLNVIDCNLCVKGEDLDCQQGMINFSLYLRSSHHYYQPADSILDPDNMTTVLDQKNYIEELNRHLNATVSNLESKVETLQTTNALMKEDLDIARKNLILLTDENHRLRDKEAKPLPSDDKGGGELDPKQTKAFMEQLKAELSSEMQKLKTDLETEKKKRLEVEKELKLQISMKSEMEVAMKLLEKDIHEKQDTIVSLQKQLDEIKIINLEMFRKLQDCESCLKQKTELVTKLEMKTVGINESFLTLEDKLSGADQRRLVAEAEVRNLTNHLSEKISAYSNIEGELKVERDWRMSLEDAQIKDRESLSKLNGEVTELRASATHYLKLKKELSILKEDHKNLQEQCRLHELTLEELGLQLSQSKLKVVDLQEEARAKADGQWASDKQASVCGACNKDFNITRRKHHCRNCGEIFCNACSDNTTLLPSSAKPVRVCDSCHVFLVARNSVL